MNKSIIYHNILLYRGAMQLLYKGNYYNRFYTIKEIIAENKSRSVVELCFGDTIIAEYCIKNNIQWQGFDINENFVNRAIKKGFHAHVRDIDENIKLPQSELCIMMGSLYHFHPGTEKIIKNVLKYSSMFIINEPIENITGSGSLSAMAAALSNAGKGPEIFRYTRKSLLNMIENLSKELNFSYSIANSNYKDITIIIK